MKDLCVWRIVSSGQGRVSGRPAWWMTWHPLHRPAALPATWPGTHCPFGPAASLSMPNQSAPSWCRITSRPAEFWRPIGRPGHHWWPACGRSAASTKSAARRIHMSSRLQLVKAAAHGGQLAGPRHHEKVCRTDPSQPSHQAGHHGQHHGRRRLLHGHGDGARVLQGNAARVGDARARAAGHGGRGDGQPVHASAAAPSASLRERAGAGGSRHR